MTSGWAAAFLLTAACFGVAGCGSRPHYDYTHLPAGYRWRAVVDPRGNDVVFYGKDPLTHQTVYVGPDSRFYIFSHPGPIQPRDLTLHWMPHDAR